MSLLRSRMLMVAVLLGAATLGFTVIESPAGGEIKTPPRLRTTAPGLLSPISSVAHNPVHPTSIPRPVQTTPVSGIASTSTSTPASGTGSGSGASSSSGTASGTVTGSSNGTGSSGGSPSSGTESGGPTFGVSIPALINQTPATQAAWLANLKSIGITSIRIGADWAWVQYAGSTTYDWTALDQEVASIRAAGMSVDMVVLGCPPWAAAAGTANGPSPTPADPGAFAAFAATVASRYAPQGVTDFEIWNEPNNAVFWQPAPNPAAYTALLKASYASIKAADPSAFVISGGLAPEANDGTNINEVTFLQDMYADGAEGYFDALGDHPYSYPALPDTYEAWSGWSQMDQTPVSLESVLAANADASKPLWLTEVGAPSSGPGGVGTTAQAQELTQAIADAKSSSWIGALYIYTYEDSGSDPSTNEDWFGLLNADGSAKPAFSAVAAALT